MGLGHGLVLFGDRVLVIVMQCYMHMVERFLLIWVWACLQLVFVASRAYYRCSSSKGCPARKQVERSQADPDMVLVTYSYDHNHSSAAARTHNRAGAAHKPQNKEEPAPPPDLPADQSDHTHQQGAVQLVTDSRLAPAIEVHDEFRWLYDVVSVTSSTSPSDVEEADDMLMYGPMFFGKAAVGTAALLPDEFGDVLGGHEGTTTSEEDAMFAGLGELPECAMVFRRNGLAGGVNVEQPAEGTAMT